MTLFCTQFNGTANVMTRFLLYFVLGEKLEPPEEKVPQPTLVHNLERSSDS